MQSDILWEEVQARLNQYDSTFFGNVYRQYKALPNPTQQTKQRAIQVYEQYLKSLKFEEAMKDFWNKNLKPRLDQLGQVFTVPAYREFRSMAQQFLTLTNKDPVLYPFVLELQRAIKGFDALVPTNVYDPPLLV